MANLAHTIYLFYGDKTELTKCREEFNKLYDRVGNHTSCVHGAENLDDVRAEWIVGIEELSEDADSFRMDTISRCYGNPVYWDNWVKANFPKLSVAFRCEAPALGIFQVVDPDNKFDDCIYIHASNIPAEDIDKLPQVLKDAISEGGIWGRFSKGEVFNSKFQPCDLPDSVVYSKYTSTTYDKVSASDEARLARLNDIFKDD